MATGVPAGVPTGDRLRWLACGAAEVIGEGGRKGGVAASEPGEDTGVLAGRGPGAFACSARRLIPVDTLALSPVLSAWALPAAAGVCPSRAAGSLQVIAAPLPLVEPPACSTLLFPAQMLLAHAAVLQGAPSVLRALPQLMLDGSCLLYTSDAADE